MQKNMRITVDLLIFAKSSKKTLKVKTDFVWQRQPQETLNYLVRSCSLDFHKTVLPEAISQKTTPSLFLNPSLHELYPYTQFFWSVFSHIWTEYGEILPISPYSVRMRKKIRTRKSTITRNFYTVVPCYWSLSIAPENIKKPEAFWYIQEVQTQSSSMKWVND